MSTQTAIGDIEAFAEVAQQKAALEIPDAVKTGLLAFSGMESNYGAARASSSGNHTGYMHMGAEAFRDGLAAMAPVVRASSGNTQMVAAAGAAGKDNDNANFLSGLGYMVHNARLLTEAGKTEFTLTDLYLMHNLGPAQGKKIALANDGADIANLGVPQSFLDGNHPLYLCDGRGSDCKTVGQSKEYIDNWIRKNGADPTMKFRLDEKGMLVPANEQEAAKGKQIWQAHVAGVDPQIMASRRSHNPGLEEPDFSGDPEKKKKYDMMSQLFDQIGQGEGSSAMLMMLLVLMLVLGGVGENEREQRSPEIREASVLPLSATPEVNNARLPEGISGGSEVAAHGAPGATPQVTSNQVYRNSETHPAASNTPA